MTERGGALQRISGERFLNRHVGGKATQDSARIVIDPTLDALYFFVPKGCDIAAFGNKAPNDPVAVLIRRVVLSERGARTRTFGNREDAQDVSLQCWFNLSDEGVEDAIYDSYAMRKLIKINFIDEQLPDATTLCKFRHLLEANGIGAQIFPAVRTALDRTVT